jgi:hypothetical protein
MQRTDEYHWVFGTGIHLEFASGGEPILSTSLPLNSWEGSAAISDNFGNLLFYTDSVDVYDSTGSKVNQSTLGGDPSSAHAAIIVPPAGGGNLYHIFCVGADYDGTADTIRYSSIAIQNGNVVVITTNKELFNNKINDSSERILSVSHVDCNNYWVIFQPETSGKFYSLLIKNDNEPSEIDLIESSVGLQGNFYTGYYCAAASSNGEFLAYTDYVSGVGDLGQNMDGKIRVFNFDNSTGKITHRFNIDKVIEPYGVEFSPDSKIIYYSTNLSQTSNLTGKIYSHEVVNGGADNSQKQPIFEESGGSLYNICSMRLGPNNKIYARVYDKSNLICIENPNVATNPQVISSAVDAGGVVIDLSSSGTPAGAAQTLGLPSFTKVSDNCFVKSTCVSEIAEIEGTLISEAMSHVNSMALCGGSEGTFPSKLCSKFDFPSLRPNLYITFGDSSCDCIESDDTEVMSITVCNPYSNLSFHNFDLASLSVFDASGASVGLLPDGTPSITLVPKGPYCFGDIDPCSCISREFTLRLRGAISGKYEIKISKMCFDVCLHEDQESCFEFYVCKD